MSHTEEIAGGERFAFGENWSRYLRLVGEVRIEAAVSSLQRMLEVDHLAGRTFLDIGSGSGLFSLAAHRLGASVRSFDYDPQSAACTAEMRRRFGGDSGNWITGQGSVLDPEFVASLGEFDVVYSWGVLHHTGAMWQAIENAAARCRPGGMFFLAIYNDQGGRSRRWRAVKRLYCKSPRWCKPLVLYPSLVRLWGPECIKDALRGGFFTSWRRYDKGGRGMSAWRDVVDWVGGYPFEVATPDTIFDFLKERGFRLEKLLTRQGHGCNEFVFRRERVGADSPRTAEPGD